MISRRSIVKLFMSSVMAVVAGINAKASGLIKNLTKDQWGTDVVLRDEPKAFAQGYVSTWARVQYHIDKYGEPPRKYLSMWDPGVGLWRDYEWAGTDWVQFNWSGRFK